MTMFVKNFCVCLLVAFGLLLSGCSKNVSMGGKVTFSDDGSPLSVGTVCFESATFLARGEIKPDGTYVIGSLSEKDGLPAGTYKVCIAGAAKEIGKTQIDSLSGTQMEGMPIYEPLIDEKFAKAATSGIEITVDNKTKSLDFKVDRFKKK
ncbi:MAG: hypothetical protein ACRC46_08980 [Thermoguttaceae bacterium]